eukprot:scaffold160198_cov27-Tisochrysis_lutea.AAC.1
MAGVVVRVFPQSTLPQSLRCPPMSDLSSGKVGGTSRERTGRRRIRFLSLGAHSFIVNRSEKEPD